MSGLKEVTDYIPQNYYFWEYYKLFNNDCTFRLAGISVCMQYPKPSKPSVTKNARQKKKMGSSKHGIAKRIQIIRKTICAILDQVIQESQYLQTLRRKQKHSGNLTSYPVWVNNTITWTNSDEHTTHNHKQGWTL